MEKYSGVMESYDSLLAICEIEDYKLTIQCDKNYLYLLVKEDEESKIRKYHFNNEYFSFRTLDSKYEIEFFIYDGVFQINECPKDLYEIIIPLKMYIVYDLSKSNKGIYLEYQSDQIHKFVGLSPKFQEIIKGNDKISKYTINPNFYKIKHEKFLTIDKNNAYIGVGYNSTKFKQNIIEIIPKFYLKFESSINHLQIEQSIFSMFNFIKYCLMRNDIYPDVFTISNGKYIGELRINNPYKLKDKKIFNDSSYSDSFTWKLLYNHVDDLINSIYKNKLFLFNIPENLYERKIISFKSIALDSSAFEYEFRSLYGNSLINYKNYNKSIMDNIISRINNSGDKRIVLKDKIAYCFWDNETYHKDFKSFFNIKEDFYDLGINCANLRNDIDHGNILKYKFNNSEESSMLMLKALVIAMQLRNNKYSSKEVNKLLISLFKF